MRSSHSLRHVPPGLGWRLLPQRTGYRSLSTSGCTRVWIRHAMLPLCGAKRDRGVPRCGVPSVGSRTVC